jgi:hypothetical protein
MWCCEGTAPYGYMSSILFFLLFKPFCHPLRQGTAAAVAVSFTAGELDVSPEHEGKAEGYNKLECAYVVVAGDEVLDAEDEHDDGDDEAHDLNPEFYVIVLYFVLLYRTFIVV